ncbi:MAG: prepilin-type N-terminal cleavage/methylation domain-containing protein [Quadrisphaera sp.]
MDEPARRVASDSGFSLVEVIVSMVLLGLVALAMLPVMATGAKTAAANRDISKAAQYANTELTYARQWTAAGKCANVKNKIASSKYLSPASDVADPSDMSSAPVPRPGYTVVDSFTDTTGSSCASGQTIRITSTVTLNSDPAKSGHGRDAGAGALMQRLRPLRPLGDRGVTLSELVVSVLAGSIVLLAAAAIFVPASQNAARDRQAGVNIATANSVSQILQRQVRDATYVSVSLVGNKARVLQLCTYPTASSSTRTKVVWRYVAGTGLSMTTGSASSGTLYGDANTFDFVRFGWDDTAKTFSQYAPMEIKIRTGDIADAKTTGTVGTTLEFTTAARPVQVTSPTGSCA